MGVFDDNFACSLGVCKAGRPAYPGHVATCQAGKNTEIPAVDCAAATLVCALIQKAIADERARAAAREVADYSLCFGPNAPVGAKAKYHKIIRVASTRMAIALLNLPSF
jgi:hypothetical protein